MKKLDGTNVPDESSLDLTSGAMPLVQGVDYGFGDLKTKAEFGKSYELMQMLSKDPFSEPRNANPEVISFQELQEGRYIEKQAHTPLNGRELASEMSPGNPLGLRSPSQPYHPSQSVGGSVQRGTSDPVAEAAAATGELSKPGLQQMKLTQSDQEAHFREAVVSSRERSIQTSGGGEIGDTEVTSKRRFSKLANMWDGLSNEEDPPAEVIEDEVEPVPAIPDEILKALEGVGSKPQVVALAMDELLGEDWVTWEFETIMTLMVDRLELSVSPELINKIMAIKTVTMSTSFWTRVQAFEGVCRAFTERPVDSTTLMGCPMYAIAAAVAVVERFFQNYDAKFSDDVSVYVAANAIQSGYMSLPHELSFARDQFMIEFTKRLGRSSGADLPNQALVAKTLRELASGVDMELDSLAEQDKVQIIREMRTMLAVQNILTWE